jgi:hypothetical protein
MTLTIQGLEPIVIPDHLLSQEPPEAFTSTTSYLDRVAARIQKPAYLKTLLPSKLLCLGALKKRALELAPYESYLDLLAGIGLSARIFENEQPCALNELDEKCGQVLLKNFQNKPSRWNMFEMPMAHRLQAVFADFNNFTFKRYFTEYKPVLDWLFQNSQRHVILNDCSLFYFRYGKQSFMNYSGILGEEIESIADYFLAIRGFYERAYPGWWLVQAEYFRESSFLLFSRQEAPLVMHEVRPEDVPEGYVRVT